MFYPSLMDQITPVLTADTTLAPDVLRGRPARATPLPPYVMTTDRLALPLQLDWYSPNPRPAIGERVEVTRAGEGPGTVVGYFYKPGAEDGQQVEQGGELGITVQLDEWPEWLPTNDEDVVRLYADEFEAIELTKRPQLAVSLQQAAEALPQTEQWATSPFDDMAPTQQPAATAPVAQTPRPAVVAPEASANLDSTPYSEEKLAVLMSNLHPVPVFTGSLSPESTLPPVTQTQALNPPEPESTDDSHEEETF